LIGTHPRDLAAHSRDPASLPKKVIELRSVSDYNKTVLREGKHMSKQRTARILYFLGVVAAFVIAAGADRKFGS
jgi:hypothetical protein